MKKIALLLVLTISLSNVFSQNPSYNEVMKKNKDLFVKASNISEYQDVANKFEIVVNKETTKWLPLYYVALAKVFMSHKEKDGDKKDLYLDDAQKFVDKALAINSNESEIIVLQGFLHQARISVSPISRGQRYSSMSNNSFSKAAKINSENPRAYYLMGMNVLNTPAMFGGGKEKALPLFQKAKQKYDNFIVSNELLLNWGAKGNKERLEYCSN